MNRFEIDSLMHFHYIFFDAKMKELGSTQFILHACQTDLLVAFWAPESLELHCLNSAMNLGVYCWTGHRPDQGRHRLRRQRRTKTSSETG